MKITTEDCVNYLIHIFPATQAKDWKRRSKKWNSGATIRTFENVATGQTYEVVERNGSIVDANGKPPAPKPETSNAKSKYVYGLATVRTDEVFDNDDTDGFLCVAYRGKYTTDQVEEDVCNMLEELGVIGADETNFEIPKGKKEKVIEALKNNSLIAYDPDFQKYLQKFSETYGWAYDKP
jgi:hypothetical protein